MTKTRAFEARLPDGSTTEIEAKWCDKARWYVGRHDGGTFYFETGGEQV